MKGHDERIIHLPPSPEEQLAIDVAREALQADPQQADRLRRRLESIQPLQVRHAWQRRRRWTAASAVALAATLAFALIVGPRLAPKDDPIVRMVVETSTHAPETISPVFGVTLDVAESSRISVVADRSHQVAIDLRRGEVVVDFEPSASAKALEVVAGDVTVSVTGTRFGVSRRGNDIAAWVDHGSVRVTWPDGETELGDGESWHQSRARDEAVASRPSERAQRTLGDDARADDGTAAPPHVALVTHEPPSPQVSEQATLLARIEIDRASGIPAADRLGDLDLFLVRYPDDPHGEEVLALKVEALAAVGADSQVLTVAQQFTRTYPDGTRRREVRWIEATVARDRLHDCAHALPIYRDLAGQAWGLWAEAAFFHGVCAADEGHYDEARDALNLALTGALQPTQEAEARRVLDDLPIVY
jgi:hypothetical protein